MKLNKTIYALSMAGMMGFWSCTSDEAMPDRNIASGERVPITIEVSHGGDVQTRTDLSEDLQEGGLTHTWAAGDELYLYDSTGAEAGKVTLESGEGTSSGIFTGEVTAASGEYCLWYFGSKQSNASDADFATCYPYVTISNRQVTIDLKKPTFTNAEEFSKVDVLSQMATVNVNGRTASVAEKITMRPHVALARFDLQNLPANVTGILKLYDTKAKTPEYINTKQTLSLAKGETAKSEETEAYTFTDWSSDKDLYVAFVPYSSNLKFEYTYNKEVQENGSKKIYQIKNIHSFAENQNLVAGTYYQSFKPAEGSQTATVGGVEVPFEIDDSDNPGNMDNWGGNHGTLGGVPSFIYAGNSDDDAWVSNTRVISERKYKKTSTPRYNIINNGHLISWDYNGQSDYEAKYFQWGRLLGFPWRVMYVEVDMLSWMYYSNLSYNDLKYVYPFGMNEYTDPILYYSWDMDSRPTYAVTTAWSSGMRPDQAVNSSIVYITGDGMDYLKTAYRKYDWNKRSGNPCPDGFRVPTKEELELYVPSKSFVNSLVEYKTIKGIRYAVRWKLSSDKRAVTVNTAITDRTDVKIDDAIFVEKNNLTLETAGLLYQDFDYPGSACLYDILSDDEIGKCYVGYYWSSSYKEDGNNIYGWALRLGISGNNVNIVMEDMEPIVGCGIIPIKDDSAKATGFQPWFPIGI